jgi:PRTRC genetic system protein B
MIRIADEDLQKWLMSIHVYEESIFISQLDPKTGAKKEYEVSAADLANRMNLTAKLSTGLMKPNTLFYHDDGAQERVMIYIPAAVRQMNISLSKGMRKVRVPMPPMVFWNKKNKYYIAALTSDKISAATRLAAAPVPNVHDDGEVCAGNVKFPKGSIRTINEAERLFWESEFNGDLVANKCQSHRADVRKLYKGLKGRFPKNELTASLVSKNTLGELITCLQSDSAEMVRGEEE